MLCAACQAREARYGFRADGDDPQVDRPRTLCFECFRVEIARRQEAAQAVQVRLPLEETLDALSRRRRRAQIAARHALGRQRPLNVSALPGAENESIRSPVRPVTV